MHRMLKSQQMYCNSSFFYCNTKFPAFKWSYNGSAGTCFSVEETHIVLMHIYAMNSIVPYSKKAETEPI